MAMPRTVERSQRRAKIPFHLKQIKDKGGIQGEFPKKAEEADPTLLLEALDKITGN